MLSAYFAERGIALQSLPGGGAIPLRFSDPAKEHLATRRSAGLFDFSFMGWWEVTGRNALRFLQFLQTRNLRELEPGRLCYTLLCRHDGSVFVDATIWCHDRDRYWIFTGRPSDEKHLADCAQGFAVEITALAQSHAIIAAQGPSSATLLERMLPGSVTDLRYYGFRRRRFEHDDVWIARLGYTGELGYEILVSARDAVRVWQCLATSVARGEVSECGFEAADSLRIEAGFIHFARELETRVFPAEVSLSRLVVLHHGDFIGREALRETGGQSHRRLAGFEVDADAHRSMYRVPGRSVVHVTSEAFSPIFGRVLGLGFVERHLENGAIVYTADGRRARLCRLPFRDPARALSRQWVGPSRP
jgi:aminomethyltransferase